MYNVPEKQIIPEKEPDGSALDELINVYKSNIVQQGSEKGLPRKILDTISEHKYAAIGLGAPFIMFADGLAQGLDPKGALIYTFARFATLFSVDPASASWVHEFEHASNPEQTKEILRELLPGVEETFVFGLAGAAFIDKVNDRIKNLANFGRRRKEQIRSGEAPVKPIGEKMFIYGGQRSDFVEAFKSIDVTPAEYVPIFKTQAGATVLLHQFPKLVDEDNGFYVALENGVPSEESEEWDLLELTKKNLIHTQDGKNVLFFVGNGNKSGYELSTDPHDIDVTLPDIHIGIEHILERLHDIGRDDIDVVSVNVGNGDVVWPDKENPGQTITDRQRAERSRIEVYIDIKSLLRRVMHDRLEEEDVDNVRFVADPSKRSELEELQEYLPVTVQSTQEDNGDAALIIRGEDNKDTINTAFEMKKIYSDKKIFIITTASNFEEILVKNGIVKEVEHKLLQNESNNPFDIVHEGNDKVDNKIEVINLSKIAAKAVLLVREMVKKGYTPEQIQTELDSIFPPLKNIDMLPKD